MPKRIQDDRFIDDDLVEFGFTVLGLVAAGATFLASHFLFKMNFGSSVFIAFCVAIAFSVLGEVAGRFWGWKNSGAPLNRIKLVAWLAYIPIVLLLQAMTSSFAAGVIWGSMLFVVIWTFGHIKEWIAARRQR